MKYLYAALILILILSCTKSDSELNPIEYKSEDHLVWQKDYSDEFSFTDRIQNVDNYIVTTAFDKNLSAEVLLNIDASNGNINWIWRADENQGDFIIRDLEFSDSQIILSKRKYGITIIDIDSGSKLFSYDNPDNDSISFGSVFFWEGSAFWYEIHEGTFSEYPQVILKTRDHQSNKIRTIYEFEFQTTNGANAGKPIFFKESDTDTIIIVPLIGSPIYHKLQAINMKNSEIIWNQHISGTTDFLVSNKLALKSIGNTVIHQSNEQIKAFDRFTGTQLWFKEVDDDSEIFNFQLDGNYIYARNGRYLIKRSIENGSMEWKRKYIATDRHNQILDKTLVTHDFNVTKGISTNSGENKVQFIHKELTSNYSPIFFVDGSKMIVNDRFNIRVYDNIFR